MLKNVSSVLEIKLEKSLTSNETFIFTREKVRGLAFEKNKQTTKQRPIGSYFPFLEERVILLLISL